MSLRTRIESATLISRALALMVVERFGTGIVFNPMSEALRSDPYPFYERLRRVDPFHRCRNGPGWVLSRYADILAVLRDPTLSSDERNHPGHAQLVARLRRAGLRDTYEDDRGSMLRLDPPTHTRLRALVSKVFTPRAIQRIQPRIEAIVRELVDTRAESGAMELVTELAAPLPIMVIAEALGIPAEDHQRFRAWSNEIVRNIGDASLDDRRAAERAGAELDHYFETVIEARRQSPKDDLISALAAAEEAGDRLKRNELLSVLTLLLVAGNETTTNLISNATLALLRSPEQLEILRREPSRIAGAIEELLRYDAPVQMTSRFALADGEVCGHRIRRGDHLIMLLGSANRDPSVFPDADRLDVTRYDVRHLAFSHGIHFCLGAQLARLEAALALEALIRRFPRFTLRPQKIAWSKNPVLRGPRALWLDL